MYLWGTLSLLISLFFNESSTFRGTASQTKKNTILKKCLKIIDTFRYLHHNHIGSIVATKDSNGDVVNSYAYSPFGECSSMSGTTFGFTGQRYDPEIGLYYYKNRHYSPKIGRFLQPDPLGYVDGLNSYQYAFNDPLQFTDSLGLSSNPGRPWGDNNNEGRDPFRQWGYNPTYAEVQAFLNNSNFHGLHNNFVMDLANFVNSLSPSQAAGLAPGLDRFYAALASGETGNATENRDDFLLDWRDSMNKTDKCSGVQS